MGSKISQHEICSELTRHVYDGNPTRVEELVQLLNNTVWEGRPPDRNYGHPILMESASQAGLDPNGNYDEKQKDRFTRQNKIFKILWSCEAYKPYHDNPNYTDKYGNTAKQRLAIERCDDPEMSNFIKEVLKVRECKTKYRDRFGQFPCPDGDYNI